MKLLNAIENERTQREIQTERRRVFGECLKEVQITWMHRAGQMKNRRSIPTKSTQETALFHNDHE